MQTLVDDLEDASNELMLADEEEVSKFMEMRSMASAPNIRLHLA